SGVRYIVRGIEPAAIPKAARHVAQKGDDFARNLHRVDTEWRQRGMRLESTHAATVAFLTLVRDHEAHPGRLADDAACRADSPLDDVGDQAPHADASHFLVVGQRKMKRPLKPAPQELRDEGEPYGRETLHVGHPATVEFVPDQRCCKRRRVPWLSV